MKKGSKHSAETIEKMREAQRGSKNHNWKGDNISIHAGQLRAQRRFKAPRGKERHHIDGNSLNNEADNIAFVTRREHMIEDGRLEALITRNKSGKYVFARGANGRYIKKNRAGDRATHCGGDPLVRTLGSGGNRIRSIQSPSKSLEGLN